MRPDQTDYLAHFTKGESAYDNLVSILSERRIRAGNLPWTKKPAVCFTECPWSSLLEHAQQYSPYAVGFSKPRVFAAGGGPAYYVRADHFKKQQWADHVYAFVTPFWPDYRPAGLRGEEHLGGKTVDYSHEREWRVPHDFTFESSQVDFVILNDYQDMARLDRDIKDQVGREKFILMDVYRRIEQLWPTHLAGRDE